MNRPLELWVGVEPTVNRVGDSFLHQLERSGFAQRPEDLDRLASLGAKRVRFPVLWERVAPDRPDEFDWTWTDDRLARLRELHLHPIAGLLHHGSGPKYTDLTDDHFPEKLAAFARAVAERYPWLGSFTPVNEPLTTARFSGLYGHWYPHGRDDRTFVRTLLNQVRGTVLAMRAIREVNPAAQLVQTEDLGFTQCTPPLQYQADFENVRRWLSYDLLTGQVDEQHPLWKYLTSSGALETELHQLRENPCPPDMLGINAYITSERFLDHRLERYPRHLHGGNGRDRYVDVEAVRVLGEHVQGFTGRLREAHERYGLPIAITETHLGCTREEQLRWLRDTWRAAQEAREQEGVDVRAVTLWSAFGAFDWDSLLTRNRGHYEPGVWDVRSPEPRPTALVQLARDLAAGRDPTHPVLHAPGWWRRSLRHEYPPEGDVHAEDLTGTPLLITGATGTLGRAFARLCEVRGLPYHLLSREEMDITDAESVRAALERWQPWALINTAGYVRVDDAERDPRNARENTLGPAVLAAACALRGVRLVTFSSDLVFDGLKGGAYVESDTPAPLNAYGRSKLNAERRVLSADPSALVVRAAAFFGPWDAHNFVTLTLAALREGRPWTAAEDQVVSPTFVPDLVNHTLDLLLDGERGVWHLANVGAVSWAELARIVADMAGLNAGLVRGVPSGELGQVAARPAYSALASERGWVMPPLEHALERYFRTVERQEQRILQVGD